MITSNEAAIEQAVQDKGLTAPRVTPEQVTGKIVREDYHVFPGTTVTVCALTLANGFTTVGHSAAASQENFDAELGRSIAYTEARDKIWELEGYLLRQQLSQVTENKPPG